MAKYPYTRLGKINTVRSFERLQHLCDFIDLKKNEIFFDRSPESFSVIINFYRDGRLHLNQNICVISFMEGLAYWGLDENLIDSCCFLKYVEAKEQVLDQIRL